MRMPAAMGFYPFNRDELKEQVSSFLKAEKKIENPMGVIVPHAGYIYSGSVAGKTLKSAETDKRIFMIFGPNHTGFGIPVAMSDEDWRTPMGTVKVEKGVIEKLEQAILIDNTAHQYEHSLEVQLPFLQVLYNNFSIVPICLQQLSFTEINELADRIFQAVDCKKIFFIASSDFMHFGPMYGYVPVQGNIEEKLKWVKEKDNEAIALICKLKAEEFYSYVTENRYTICGFVPITLLILLLKKIGAKKGELIDYKTSYEVSKSDSFVTYAGIVIS